MNPITSILEKYPLCILDGAFSTELERRGCDLNDPLWSAKVLIENPDDVTTVHEEYFRAGADCVITASYQATFEGFMNRGLSEDEASRLIGSSVTLAKQARDRFWAKKVNQLNRPKPLVAASVGPYGAYLADGSEYRGNYDIDEEGLVQFHRKRMSTLIAAGPDILACETIPCLAEARALVRLLNENPGIYGWISFSAQNGEFTNNGERLEECARFLNRYEQVAAVGINCTAPEHIESLIDEIRKGSDKPIVLYPNSGEHYDTVTKTWTGGSSEVSFSDLAKRWYNKGARIIGGCCRTTPDDIHRIASWARSRQHP
jgi:homocysteine S-methyltransferase